MLFLNGQCKEGKKSMTDQFQVRQIDPRPSRALLLPTENAESSSGPSMFERIMLMVMAIVTSVASIVFIIISVRAYLFLLKVSEALNTWSNQLHVS